MKNLIFQTLILSLVASLSSCTGVQRQAPQGPEMLTFREEFKNTPQAKETPYVILVSIDGYRHDYNEKFKPEHLGRIAKEGVQAQSLIPVYPSKTFPNHYSLATGLYPDKHGIVSNSFYDPLRDASYSLPDREAVEDGSWYEGNPLWLAVQKHGLKTASFFWVGSEADIQGKYPNYYFRYDQNVDHSVRIKQVLDWLTLPEAQRPHFITLYFSEVDSAGHRFGTNSEELKTAVANVDQAMGSLVEGLKKTNLPVNLIVVSDHGMADISPDRLMIIDTRPEVAELLKSFRIVGGGTQMLLYLNNGEDKKKISILASLLKKQAKNYKVFTQGDLDKLKFSHRRSGDLVIEADPHYLLGLSAGKPFTTGANHGWMPEGSKDMHGIFMAMGPAFKSQAKTASFEVVDVYPLVMEVLGLKPTSIIDGKLERSISTLKGR